MDDNIPLRSEPNVIEPARQQTAIDTKSSQSEIDDFRRLIDYPTSFGSLYLADLKIG